jgi:diacylglycerol kinase family enzyme
LSALGPVALIANPGAMRSSPAARSRVTRALAPAGLEWSFVTTGPGDAARLAREAVAQGAAAVVALGGDGVVGEVAGALAGGPVAMAPLPGGNANVFARAIGWPASLDQALPLLAPALAAGRTRDAALGLVRAGGMERVFVVNAGVGLDAATVEWIEARPRTKRRLRQAGFALGVAVAVARARRAPRLRVSIDDADAVDCAAVLVACGTPYTYLGRRPLDLAPGAAFDGRLAWLGLTRVRPDEIARLMLRAARGRDLPIGGPALTGGPVARSVVVHADAAGPVQADGEPLGRHTEVRISPGPVLHAVEPRPAP